MTDVETNDGGEQHLRLLALAARAQGGKAMHSLLVALAPLVRRYCAQRLSRTGRADWTEDYVQDIMLTVHLKLHTYDEAVPFLAWLYAVSKHKIIDGLRRERITPVSLDAAAELTDGDHEAPLARRDLAKLLSQLKPPAGEIIHALKVEGASVASLAERFAMSESNIKIIVHRGLRRLSDLLTRGNT